ncbi:MAG: family 20 glycosylhydrolase [Bacteroidota bacterium]
MRPLLPFIFFSCLCMGLFPACQVAEPLTELAENMSILPKPVKLTPREGTFYFQEGATILALGEDPAILNVVQYFRDYWQKQTGWSLQLHATEGNSKADISLLIDEEIQGEEAYALSVSPTGVLVRGGSVKGLFYGLQSLRQLLPAEIEGPASHGRIGIPAVEINDHPHFAYRGMHLDVSRHFFPVPVIKRYLDLMALYKLNHFHWHLTDDQGWRIEIKKYPKLTEVGAYREETLIGHYQDQPHQFDGQRYGGFYTQEEIREVVAYATARQITVIPEIEMPGHARAALAAYPELGCTDGPFKVATLWGVFEAVFCPKEETFTFLENVLLEVMELFPGTYIHIGGDECPKKAWEESEFCQQLMRRERLRDENELQSYFIRRMETFLQGHGRNLIGWDEILEGGLPPQATVMSWRGMAGGIEAAKAGHRVIMTPGKPLYFDHYQASPAEEPTAFGGFNPIEQVYAFDPLPAELSPEEQALILGAQANLWTEYIQTPEQLEYMAYPRALALAEALWTPADQKSWADFAGRLPRQLDRLQVQQVNYAPRFFDVFGEPEVAQAGELGVRLAVHNAAAIHYTLDGSEPTTASLRYEAPVRLAASATLTALAFDEGGPQGRAWSQAFVLNKATARSLNLAKLPDERYPGGGPYGLVNGVKGDMDFGGTAWSGFSADDMEATIDLGGEDSISEVSLSFLHSPGAWIFMPEKVEVLVSGDGTNFRDIAFYNLPEADQEATPSQLKETLLNFDPTAARYVRVIARNLERCPSWHPGAGKDCWLFVDEIQIR